MSWFKKTINTASKNGPSEELIDPFNASPESNQEYVAQVEANKELSNMDAIAEDREKEESARAEQLVIIHGAKIKMGAHLGEFKVLNDVPTTQDKLTGTIVEKTIPNFTFYDGFQLLSILGDWQDYGSYLVQDNEVLIKKSRLQVMGKMPGSKKPETGYIEFIDSGQVNMPEQISTKGAPVPEVEEPDFNIVIEIDKNDFVPLGIPDFNGNVENDVIKIKILISGNGVNEWSLKIKSGDNVIKEFFSATQEIEEVVITKPAKNIQINNSAGNEKTQAVNRFWPAGSYIIYWDGFDKDNIYDSKIFTDKDGLSFEVVGQADYKHKSYIIDEPVKFTYKEISWVDVTIHKIQKIINLKLRLSLKDGGARGLKCRNVDLDPDPKYRQIVEKCPWHKIPEKSINTSQPILKTQTRSYDQLEKLAIDGIKYHWGRNRNHAVAKGVLIDNESFEVFIEIQNILESSTNKGSGVMDAVDLIYNTNGPFMRSGNPGSATLNPISWAGNLVSREAVCYNVGYIKYSEGWFYQEHGNEDINFKETAAHEIGHEIIKMYGGTIYSYGHKETVNVILQKKNANAINYPLTGEIDIMPYYQNYIPIKERSRMVAAEHDVLGLIWLTKLKPTK